MEMDDFMILDFLTLLYAYGNYIFLSLLYFSTAFLLHTSYCGSTHSSN